MQDVRDIHSICLNCFGTLDPRTYVCTKCNKRAADNQTPSQAIPMRSLLAGRYLIGMPLGRGGFGITYKAYDMLTCTRVAIKEFFPKGYTQRMPHSCAVDVNDANNAKVFNYWLTAFIQEAKVLTSIKHLDGIVEIYDFFLTNNTAYIVMEYLDGMSLHRFIHGRGGRLHINETLNIMRPVLETLLRLHQHGVIHKDISPENIQIVNNRQIKLLTSARRPYTRKTCPSRFSCSKRDTRPSSYTCKTARKVRGRISTKSARLYTPVLLAIPRPKRPNAARRTSSCRPPRST